MCQEGVPPRAAAGVPVHDDAERPHLEGEGDRGVVLAAEVLALKHESRILGQWSNPESGSWKSQDGSPRAKQHRVNRVSHPILHEVLSCFI